MKLTGASKSKENDCYNLQKLDQALQYITQDMKDEQAQTQKTKWKPPACWAKKRIGELGNLLKVLQINK